MLKVSLRFAWRSLNHLTRLALIGAVVALFVGSGVLLTLRYWVLPDIGRYHSDITAMASHAIGQPVIIGKIEADWRGLRPHLQLTDVRVLDKQGQTALVLPRVDNVVSWMSLVLAEIRLYSMEFDQPDLLIKRDAQGLLHVAGMTLPSQETAQISGQATDADWLLQQSRIVVRNARITWQDELRAAPLLVLNNVNLIIENGRFIENVGLIADSGLHHRFTLHASPPQEISPQLDVRGDFNGESFGNLNAWSGQFFTQLDYVDVAAWRTWLPLPAALYGGKGALRSWVGIENGKISQFTADLALAAVQVRLADDLPPLDVLAMRGRVAWADVAQGFEISTRKLSLHLSNGLDIPPTDFYLHLARASDGQTSSGEVRANKLELVKFIQLADFLPLRGELKQQLVEYAAQGLLSDLQVKWQRELNRLLHYEIKARFDDLSMRRVGKLPGFSGLSGSVSGNDTGGTLSLNSQKLKLDAPEIMPEPLAFDTLTAQGGWQSNERGMEVKFNNVFVANEDLSGNLFGSYQTVPEGPGVIDLTVHLSRVSIRQAARYIPLVALKDKAHEWLHSALIDGQSEDFRLRLHGDMIDFPFNGNGKGIFQIHASARGVAIEYAKGWPRVENAYADLLINGKHLEVTAPLAMTSGVHLQKISAVIPDIASPDLALKIYGEVAGETQRCLDYIRKSPVRGYVDGFTDGITTSGKGNLVLQVDVPLQGGKPVTVSGSYHFVDNDISLGASVPTLSKTNGDLLFTESSLRTRNATAQIFGGPATLQVQSGADGTTHAVASGRANPDVLLKSMPRQILLYLHGSTPWETEITIAKKQVNLTFSSDLMGLSSDLPAPLSKSATESIPLRIKKISTDARHDMLSVQYGDRLSAKFQRQESNGIFVIKRGLVSFGEPGKWPVRDGVWLTGTLPNLSLQGWGPVFDLSSGPEPLNIGGIDLQIGKVSGYGYKVDDLRITARNRNNVLFAQLASSAINGEVKWQPQGNGKLTAHMKNVSLEKEVEHQEESGKLANIAQRPNVAKHTARTGLPAIDMQVDSISLRGNHVGKLELQGHQQGSDWLLDKMQLTNPDGLLKADGKWQMGDSADQTLLNIKMEISDAGNVLARSGYPNSVRHGSGKLEGAFSWPGEPSDFSYALLGGAFRIDTGKGQFLQIDPGAGKLLSIMSLQSLPKHLTLDFADVFSRGFAFDSISGSAQINQGVLSTSDFKIEGSAAKVTMSGQVDLNNETQNLRIRILPTVGNSMSLLGALAINPAVGVGVYLANKILREPLDKLASFEYNVTGTWADPNVEKVGENKLSEAPAK